MYFNFDAVSGFENIRFLVRLLMLLSILGLNNRRSDPAVIVHNERLYAIGGFADRKSVLTIEVSIPN